MELKGYSWSTCTEQPRFVDCHIGVVNKLDNRLDDEEFCWQRLRLAVQAKFSYSGVKSQRQVPYFWTHPDFLITQCRIGGRKLPYQCQKPARFVQSFRYITGLWRTDGRTHDDSIYRACIASRGKKQFTWQACVTFCIVGMQLCEYCLLKVAATALATFLPTVNFQLPVSVTCFHFHVYLSSTVPLLDF